MTTVSEAFHTQVLPLLELRRSRLPSTDQATARVVAECSHDRWDACGVVLECRPEQPEEALELQIELGRPENELELDAYVVDVNNHEHAPITILPLLSSGRPV